jgi:error-prone DNA polymerase
MSMLPRLRPREFFDLVIEVAIVRPGPIVGQMVHPYLRQRELARKDPAYAIPFPKPELADVLGRTLGVPLFQEQAMRLAIVAAGFTGAEADELRRAMAAWKRNGGIGRFRDKFIGGMTGRGYEPDFADRCFKQICGFGEYGFPESHAASFAKLVYASAWLKRHHPAAFCCAVLNSQPMGFYAPAQLVRDAREHGVVVRPVDVNASEWHCTLEDNDARGGTATGDKGTWGWGGPAVRFGMRQIKGMRQDDAERVVAARRAGGPFASVAEVQRRTGLTAAAVRRLGRADALASLRLNRRQAAWEAMALTDDPMPLIAAAPKPKSPRPQRHVQLPLMSLGDEVLTDYDTTGLSLKRHPVFFARRHLERLGVKPAMVFQNAGQFPHGRWVKVAGLALVRQRPGTASGVVFITLEDETGSVNLILWSDVYERHRNAARHATLLQADGYVQREGQVVHVLAKRLYDRSSLLGGLRQPSRDFH